MVYQNILVTTWLQDLEERIDEFYDIDEKEAIKLSKMLDRLLEFYDEGE